MCSHTREDILRLKPQSQSQCQNQLSGIGDCGGSFQWSKGTAVLVAINHNLKLCSQVVAVAARKLEDAQEFAKKHSISRAYGSYEELARDPDVGQFL